MAEFFDTAMSLASRASPCRPATAITTRPGRTCSSGRTASKQLFRENFQPPQATVPGKRLVVQPFGLFLDFLAGNQTYQCTPWSNAHLQHFRLAAARATCSPTRAMRQPTSR